MMRRHPPSSIPDLPWARVGLLGLALLLVLALAAGCTRENAPAPAALPVEQVPLTFNQAFAQAAPELKQVAQDVVTAIQGDDAPKAFIDLQHLNSQSTLTGPQREAALRAMVTMHERLRAAADKGDKKAQETLEQYGASK